MAYSLYVLLVAHLAITTCNAQTACSEDMADIIFLLDSTTSVSSIYFEKQLQFVKNITQGFTIGKDHVQIGVVTFSTRPHNGFHLKDHLYKPALLNAIGNVPHTSSGFTFTDEALKYVRENAFLPAYGGRTGVSKIVVVLTDGTSVSTTDTAKEAILLHAAGIRIIAVGIGSSVSMTELRNIASDNAHVFTVPSFSSLSSIIAEVQSTVCVSEMLECDNQRADVVILLDASKSVDTGSFQKQLDFVHNLTDKLTIGQDNVLISVVTPSEVPYSKFYFNTFSNKQDVLHAIRNITYEQGTTNTGAALKYIRENSFLAMNGGRDNVAKLVIVLTDVNSLYPVNTAEEAKLLHWSEVKVIPIGIGSSIGQTELQNIAVDSKFVFNVSGFDALHTIERQVLTQACKIESGCSGQADIVFILDSTSSEGAVNFNKLLQFVSNFIKQFAVGPNDVQFGMVTFSTYAKAEFYLNTYTDKLSLLSKVQSVTYNGGSSALYYGLHNANMYQFQTQNGARPNARKIAIILTERRSTDVSRTINEAHLLQQKGVKVISIGIGNNVIQYELTNIASSKSDVYTIGSFDILHTIETDLKSTACGGKMAPTPNPECGTSAADIVFVLDSSSSEGTDNFHRQLDFVRDFSYQFKIGYQNVQISVVVFSSTVHEAFPLNKYTNDTSLLAAISRVAYIGGTTNTDLALSYVRQHSFLPSNGGRSNVTDIIIVITDGQSTYPSKTKIEAELLKNRTNTKVITIGIGSSVDRTELQVISSDHSHAFEVPNFTALQQITSELTFAACQTCSFVQKADIVFMLDASSSEGDTNFQKQLDFVSRLSNDFSIGKDQVQIGLITFATYPKNEFYLNTYTTKSTLLSQIQRVAYMNGQTYTDQGLEFARSNSFTPVHGDRRDAQNYLIILTDGASANPSNTLAAAQHLKQQGIRIIAIGIGNNINRNELYGIASDSNHVFTVTSFTALQQIREEIKQAACAEVLITTPMMTTQMTTTIGTTEAIRTTTTETITTTSRSTITMTSTERIQETEMMTKATAMLTETEMMTKATAMLTAQLTESTKATEATELMTKTTAMLTAQLSKSTTAKEAREMTTKTTPVSTAHSRTSNVKCRGMEVTERTAPMTRMSTNASSHSTKMHTTSIHQGGFWAPVSQTPGKPHLKL